MSRHVYLIFDRTMQIAEFYELDSAFIFMEAYINKYCEDPDIHLVLERKDVLEMKRKREEEEDAIRNEWASDF